MNSIFYLPAKIRAIAFLGLLLLALSILGGMIWRNLHHFETVLSYVNYSHRIQSISVDLQQSLIGFITETNTESQPIVSNKTLTEVETLIDDDHYLSSSTKERLESVKSLLLNIDKLEKDQKNNQLIQTVRLMTQTLEEEGLRREKLLEDINFDTQTELYIALITFTLILTGAMLFLHFRILHPLNDLRHLLDRLTEENYTPIKTAHLDPLLFPVFNSYNEMVLHLAELEEAQQRYALSLQHEVRLATQTLLEQQYSLARAERLAAIGEVAAELAHEIRNPLAGIQMAFNNLKREIDDENQRERIELIGNELKRLGHLLNDMLDQSRHSPEVATNFNMTTLIQDLLKLTRYQIPERIELINDSSTNLHVHLPESGIRQALLNLILNSADALRSKSGIIQIKTHAESGNLCIEVSDNGPGFSQDMLNYGIRPFRTSHQDGTGLGLAMVQRFVKDIGGKLKLSNMHPKGACVSILIPKACLPKHNL